MKDETIRHQLVIQEITDKYIKTKEVFEDKIADVKREGTPYYGSAREYEEEVSIQNKKIVDLNSQIFMIGSSIKEVSRKTKLQSELDKATAKRKELQEKYSIKLKIESLETTLGEIEKQYQHDLSEENELYLQNLQKSL